MKKRIIALFLCAVLLCGFASVSAFAARDVSLETALAKDLKTLGLFRGVSDTDFDLERAPTRLEALVMLVRVLGKEDAALNGGWKHPFDDVPAWGSPYVGYAYQNHLTQGISATKFGTTNSASAAMYLTFVLRALNYSDANGDFTWDQPFTLAKSIGILPDRVDRTNFWRADVVLISYAALSAKLKGTATTLSDKLIGLGAFSAEQYFYVYDASKLVSYQPEKTELNAEQIYAKCSPAVFYIEVYDRSGTATATGSGFFIDADGTAVTNYHVIEGASSAKIMLSDSGKVYNIDGVYDYSAAGDWAVVKISGSGFSYLNIADSSTVVGGATVYAIGSPLGLQNSITQGIISNTNRVEDGNTYIQTSAAISHGSSGGALINKYGEVIGITSATYTEGQNLNLALPISVISGYSRSQCTALSALASGSNTNTKNATAMEAYKYLIAFTQVYANASSSVYDYVYSETLSTANGYCYFELSYSEDNDYLLVTECENYNGMMYYTHLPISPDSLYPYIGYTVYANVYSTEPIFMAYSTVYAPGFYGNNLIFDDIRTTSGLNVATNESLASYYLKDLLSFTDYIFDSYLSSYGNFGVSLFGFTNYDKY